ncbi:hypothetical protein N2152v2_005590 [Parachlorella kessleri]
MQVQEAWAVWASAVAHGASGIDHQLLKGAVGALFQPRAAAELWQAVTDGEGSTLALAVTLKAALQLLLWDLEVAGSSPQLLTGAQAAVRTLELAKILIIWYKQPGESETHDWCGERWRPVVDCVLGWAPGLIEACMDQLSDGQTVQPCGDILPQDLDSCSAEEASKLAASSCLDLATSFLDGGAVDWLRPSPLLQALSAQPVSSGDTVTSLDASSNSLLLKAVTSMPKFSMLQQEVVLQARDWVLPDSQLAEQAAEERALLALQYHLERLARLPGHAALRSVLLNLVSAQKDALRRLAHAGKVEEMLAKRFSLRTHLKILVALLPSIRAVLSPDTVEANHCTTNGCRDRQQQGAAFQARLSLVAFCYCCEKMNEVTAALSCWDHERIVQQSVQRAKDALTVTCQAAVMGARDAQPMAGAVVLVDEIFCRMEGYLHEQPSWAATLLTHVEDLLEHFSASVQRLQKLGCQLVRTCTQAVDSLAGTDLLEGEKEVETTGSIRVRQWLAQGSDIRGAALHAAHSTWCQRWQDTLPNLTYARAAHAASLQQVLPVVPPAVSSAAGGTSSAWHAGILAMVVHRELSVSAILACANPLCPGQATAFSRGTSLRLCAGCRGVRYCSDEELYRRCGQEDKPFDSVVVHWRRRSLRFLGHLGRMPESRLAKCILWATLPDGVGRRGRLANPLLPQVYEEHLKQLDLGPFEVRHLLRLLVSALGCHGEEGRFTRDRGLFARSLAKDTGLLLATARLSMFTASRGFPKEYGESIPAAAELLSSVWEASGLKFGAIASKGSRDGGGSGNSSGQYNTTTAGTGLGSGVGLDAVLPGFAVHTAGVFWRYSVLLGRLQQQLVLKCHDEQAKVVQWACYVALRAVHSVLSEVLTALLACSNTEAPPDSANTAWQPGSQLEQQLLWKLAVSCRGALDNLVGVLTADRPYRTVVNVKHGPAPKLRASDEIAHMRCVLETGAFCLWAGMHPLWHSLWAATDAAAQQEMGLQSGDGLGGDNELAEQASEERVLLALQYHLQRLAQVPGHAALRHVLLNLVSAQKVVLMRLAAGTGDEMLVRRESLKAHLQILLALLPTIRAVPAYNAGEAVGRSVGICHYRQLQGAAIQAQVSLNGLCRCFAKLERAALGLGISYPEPAWRQSVQRAKDALTVNLQTVTMGARDADPTAGVGMLMDLFFTRMESYLQTQPARAVTLLPLAEDLLKHVAGCIAVRSMAVAMVVGCLCLRLADFLIAVLRVRRALTEDDPQFSASVQQLQKLGCQLVRTCCQAVDSVAGTDLLEDEKEVETTGGIRVRQWLAEGSDVRGAALQAALATWCQRLQVTLPRLTNAAHSAYAAGQRTRIVVRSPARSGAGSPISGGHVTMLAVRQELSLSAILACANPSCSGQAAAFGRGIKLRLCAGCRGARYCR